MLPFAPFRRLVRPRNGAYSEFPDGLSEKLSEKSLRCPKRVPTRLPNRPVRPFRPRYTGQMHLRSVTRTPFQTVSEGLFCEVRVDGVLGTSPKRHSPKFKFVSNGVLRSSGAPFVPWSTYIRLAQEYDAFVTWPDEAA